MRDDFYYVRCRWFYTSSVSSLVGKALLLAAHELHNLVGRELGVRGDDLVEPGHLLRPLLHVVARFVRLVEAARSEPPARLPLQAGPAKVIANLLRAVEAPKRSPHHRALTAAIAAYAKMHETVVGVAAVSAAAAAVAPTTAAVAPAVSSLALLLPPSPNLVDHPLLLVEIRFGRCRLTCLQTARRSARYVVREYQSFRTATVRRCRLSRMR